MRKRIETTEIWFVRRIEKHQQREWKVQKLEEDKEGSKMNSLLKAEQTYNKASDLL